MNSSVLIDNVSRLAVGSSGRRGDDAAGSTFATGWEAFWKNNGDPRVEGWPMMSSPLPTAAVCLSYVGIVKVLGPALMKDRKPFDLRSVLVAYNLVQTVFSIWLFQFIVYSGWIQKYSLKCEPVDYSNDPLAVRMVHASWWYYMAKFSEFFDTFFFVLRKKFDHISTLHLVHHGMMPLSVWFGVKFTPGGHSTFFGLLNTFVHIVMYFYYFMAALGPKYHKYLWWKKYLTTFQMVQFVCISVHAFQLFIFECDYPKAFAWWIGGHGVVFFFLFMDFFNKAYVAPAGGTRKGGARDETRTPSTNGYSRQGERQISAGDKQPNAFRSVKEALGSALGAVPCVTAGDHWASNNGVLQAGAREQPRRRDQRQARSPSTPPTTAANAVGGGGDTGVVNGDNSPGAAGRLRHRLRNRHN